MDLLNKLPEDCIARVLSFTSPQDACRLCLVGTNFRSAADSNALWEAFLPSDYKELIARAVSFSPPLTTKDLFFHLADKPLIIDNGTKSFSLEKRSGRKCYMLSARDLSISWIDSPMYWKFSSLPESRFPEVAELLRVCWLEIRGTISTKALSPNTLYGAYLVFKFASRSYGMDYHPGEVSCGIAGDASRITQSVLLDLRSRSKDNFRILFPNNFSREELEEQQPKIRRDGWMEIKMGEYLKQGLDGEGDDDGDLEMSFKEVKGQWKYGLILEGIEIRPM